MAENVTKKRRKPSATKPGSAPVSVPGPVSVAALNDLVVDDSGWRDDTGHESIRLRASVARYGQLRPIVVRRDAEGRRIVVDGRKVLKALIESGRDSGYVLDVGEVDDHEARLIMLALDIQNPIDYARLAREIAALVQSGRAASSIAAASPYSAARVQQLCDVATFDWSKYAPRADHQHSIWDIKAAPDTSSLDVPSSDSAEQVDLLT